MGKFLGIVIGAVALIIGVVLLRNWWYEFTFVLRGAIPVILIFGSIIALLAGLAELKDTLKADKK